MGQISCILLGLEYSITFIPARDINANNILAKDTNKLKKIIYVSGPNGLQCPVMTRITLYVVTSISRNGGSH